MFSFQKINLRMRNSIFIIIAGILLGKMSMHLLAKRISKITKFVSLNTGRAVLHLYSCN